MINKELVYASLNNLPDEFELDELIEKLIFLQKVKKGLNQIGKGKVKTHEEVEQMVARWRQP